MAGRSGRPRSSAACAPAQRTEALGERVLPADAEKLLELRLALGGHVELLRLQLDRLRSDGAVVVVDEHLLIDLLGADGPLRRDADAGRRELGAHELDHLGVARVRLDKDERHLCAARELELERREPLCDRRQERVVSGRRARVNGLGVRATGAKDARGAERDGAECCARAGEKIGRHRSRARAGAARREHAPARHVEGMARRAEDGCDHLLLPRVSENAHWAEGTNQFRATLALCSRGQAQMRVGEGDEIASRGRVTLRSALCARVRTGRRGVRAPPRPLTRFSGRRPRDERTKNNGVGRAAGRGANTRTNEGRWLLMLARTLALFTLVLWPARFMHAARADNAMSVWRACELQHGSAFVMRLRASRRELCRRAQLFPLLESPNGAEGVLLVSSATISRALRTRQRREQQVVQVRVPCALMVSRLQLTAYMYQERPWELATGVSKPPASRNGTCVRQLILFARDGKENPFHAVSAVAGAFFSALVVGLDPAETDVLVTDDAGEDGDISSLLLRALFHSVQALPPMPTPKPRQRKPGACADLLVVPSRHLALPWRDFHTPMALPCRNSTLFDALRSAVVRGLALSTAPVPSPSLSPLAPRRFWLRPSTARADAPELRGLVLARRHRTYRRLLNPETVIRLLREKQRVDATELELSELPLRAQLEAVRQAGVLVGVHGAALTWLLFARERTTIIELVTSRSGPFCYYNLAHLAGHRTCRYRAESASDPSRAQSGDDVLVDAPRFGAFLGLCFGSEDGVSNDDYMSERNPFAVVHSPPA